MKRRISPFIALILIAVILAGLSGVLRAQTLPDAWRTYDRFDGANGKWYFAAVQTPDAALWFASDVGILRFDGQWHVIDDVDGVPLGIVRALILDELARPVAATSNGIARFEDGDGIWLGQDQGTALGVIYALTISPSGDLWAGGDLGLFGWHEESRSWKPVTQAPNLEVWHLVTDKHGTVWLASGQRLHQFREGVWQEVTIVEQDSALSENINVLLPSAHGGLWLGTNGAGLAYLEDGILDWYHQQDGLPGENVLSLWEAPSAELWVGSNGQGVGVLADETWRAYTISDGLAANFVSAILEDIDGLMWFGTAAGISRLDRMTWQTWQDDVNAPKGLITTLTYDQEGRLWVGTYGDGLFTFYDGIWQSTVLHGDEGILPTTYVESSYVSRNGDVWFGTNNAGLIRYQGDTARRYTSAEGLAGDRITAIVQSQDGAMWFAAYGEGLSRWDGVSWQTVTNDDGLISTAIRDLFVDAGGDLWVATNRGVSCLCQDSWLSYTPADGLSAPEVTAVAETSDGSMWFATWGGGVSRLRGDAWIHYGTGDGLLAPGVEALVADPSRDQLWFGTLSGLSTFDSLTWQSFRSADGLSLGRVYAMAPSPQGGIILGTDRGVMHYQADQTAPIAQIISINGQAPQSPSVYLTPDQSLQIIFAGRDMLTATNDLFYVYQLEGHDSDWRTSRQAAIAYPVLPVGDYSLTVLTRDTAMNYSPPKTLKVLVRRQPSQIWIPYLGTVRSEYALGAVALLTVFLVLVIYAIYSTIARFAMRRTAIERRFNPYVAGSPIRDPDMFYGRESLLSEMDSALYQNSLMLHGERRIGKTSILHQLKRRLENRRDPEVQFYPVFVDLEGTPEPEFFHSMMEKVLESLGPVIETMPTLEMLRYHTLAEDEMYSDRDFRRDLREVIDHLHGITRHQPRLIFLLDEADILNTYSALLQQQLRRILQDTFARYVGAVVAGVNISKAWDRVESPWFNMFVDMKLEPFSQAEAERLIRQPVARFYTWEDRAVHYVWLVSEGRPHRIQQICLEAVNQMLDEQRRTVTLSDARVAYQKVMYSER